MSITTNARITESHLAHWREHGFVIIENFLTAEELAMARENLFALVPTWEQFAAEPGRWNNVEARTFPFPGDALNDISTHEDIHRFCASILGTDRIFLAESTIGAKYAMRSNLRIVDQQLHTDYPDNTLTFPRDDGIYRHIQLILYYSDVTDQLGPTYVVSQQYTRSRPDLMHKKMLPRETHADVYAHEVPAIAPGGAALLYGNFTFHRGSAMLAKQGARFAHHISYRALDCNWVGHHEAWPTSGNKPEMTTFIEHATPRQREMIGFPPSGDPYWNERTLDAVAKRYPGMDMTPYTTTSTR